VERPNVRRMMTNISKIIEKKVNNSYRDSKGRSIQQCRALKPNKEKIISKGPCCTQARELALSVFCCTCTARTSIYTFFTGTKITRYNTMKRKQYSQKALYCL